MEDTLETHQQRGNVVRVKTGMKGLDNLIEGGFPKGSNIVVTGVPGSGKSIFGMNFIAQGCKNGEKCLYITVEQTPEDIVDQAMQFGWDFNQWENNGNLKFVGFNLRKLSEMNTHAELRQLIEENHYDRIVIDSMTSITDSPPTINNLVDGADRGLQPSALTMMNRANVMSLFEVTKKNGVTTVSISQKIEGKPGDTVDNISEFIGDGLILLERKLIGKISSRIIEIKKLRKTNIDDIPHNFKFTKEGISLSDNEDV